MSKNIESFVRANTYVLCHKCTNAAAAGLWYPPHEKFCPEARRAFYAPDQLKPLSSSDAMKSKSGSEE